MPVKITVDISGIKSKISPSALAKGKLATANQMLLDMDRFVPYRKGDLRLSGRALSDRVTYNTPYARLRFYGKVRKGFFSEKQRRFFFANKEKLLAQKPLPGTGPRWDMKAKALYADRWAKTMMRGMGINGK